mmetsp:Transcript_10413/g.38616  ORF Transcript_10413/g.38616 Transcript_10413/m.38616 type:complete len:222 (+) Transcript_10413:194-859(+)
MIVRSASPIFAYLFRLRCARSAIFCARMRSSSFLRPAPGDLSALSERLATETERLLLLCFLGLSSSAAPSAMSSSRASLRLRLRRRPSRATDLSRARAIAALGSIPIAPRLSFIRCVVARFTGSACDALTVRGNVGALFPAPFFLRCVSTSSVRRDRTCFNNAFSSSSISGSISMSSSAFSNNHFSSSSSSSRSSSASLASISGSMKSATFLPLKISGITS